MKAADGALHEAARRAIEKGSASFAAAARLLNPATRDSVTLLYTWCRHCDDMIDGQDHGLGRSTTRLAPAERLARLESATRAALAGEPAEEPAFRALQRVTERHAIAPELPLAHLAGFRLDVEGRRYRELDDLLRYCWGVAGVVGVMMARIMAVSDRDTLDRAADLGLAFQLTNIARDVVEDAEAGRVYLPLAWLAAEGVAPERVADPACRIPVARVTARLVAAAEPYYVSALVGIGRLPPRSAAAIASARSVYRAIGRKVVQRADAAWDERVQTSRVEKLAHLVAGTGSVLAARAVARRPRDPRLWRQPV